ncbi:MAG: nucleotide sugar dehydrogenase, partial [Proteobacteria bacterium]
MTSLVHDWRPGDTMLAVVGLGYVGLALAAAFADAGFDVLGFDKQPARTAPLREGASPYHSPEPELGEMLQRARSRLAAPAELTALGAATAVFVCVETPIEADHRPRYDALRGVLAEIGPHLAVGALVVVESTVAPGTLRGVVVPALEAATGGRLGQRFHVGHCPERVTSGRLVQNLREMARVCGGCTPAVAEAMVALYK